MMKKDMMAGKIALVDDGDDDDDDDDNDNDNYLSLL